VSVSQARLCELLLGVVDEYRIIYKLLLGQLLSLLVDIVLGSLVVCYRDWLLYRVVVLTLHMLFFLLLLLPVSVVGCLSLSLFLSFSLSCESLLTSLSLSGDLDR